MRQLSSMAPITCTGNLHCSGPTLLSRARARALHCFQTGSGRARVQSSSAIEGSCKTCRSSPPSRSASLARPCNVIRQNRITRDPPTPRYARAKELSLAIACMVGDSSVPSEADPSAEHLLMRRAACHAAVVSEASAALRRDDGGSLPQILFAGACAPGEGCLSASYSPAATWIASHRCAILVSGRSRCMTQPAFLQRATELRWKASTKRFL